MTAPPQNEMRRALDTLAKLSRDDLRDFMRATRRLSDSQFEALLSIARYNSLAGPCEQLAYQLADDLGVRPAYGASTEDDGALARVREYRRRYREGIRPLLSED